MTILRYYPCISLTLKQSFHGTDNSTLGRAWININSSVLQSIHFTLKRGNHIPWNHLVNSVDMSTINSCPSVTMKPKHLSTGISTLQRNSCINKECIATHPWLWGFSSIDVSVHLEQLLRCHLWVHSSLGPDCWTIWGMGGMEIPSEAPLPLDQDFVHRCL